MNQARLSLNTNKLAVALLATLSLLAIGGGYYAEQFKPAPEVLSPQETLERSLKRAIEATYPQINDPTLSPWEKANLLRRWAYQNSDLAMCKGCLIDDQVISTQNAAELFSIFDQDAKGVYCGGAAMFLMRLYQHYGFEAYALNMGIPSSVQADNFTHVLTLVKLKHEGKEVMAIQDAFFNNTYLNQDGSPLDYFQLLKLLKNRQESQVKIHQDKDLRDGLINLDVDPDRYQCQSIEDRGSYKKCKFVSTTLEAYSQAKLVTRRMDLYFKKDGYPENILFLFFYPLGIYESNSSGMEILRHAEAIREGQLPDLSLYSKERASK